MPNRTNQRKQNSDLAPALRVLVGDDVYAVWLKMLKAVVPDGRTHRLAPLAAAMLQYAASVVSDSEELKENAAAKLLLRADEDGYSEETIDSLARLVMQLFDDAGVEYARRSSSGEDYSIAEEAASEYIAWFDMPWE